MSRGLENLIRDMQEITEFRLRHAYDALDAKGVKSPIEKYFILALNEACIVISGKNQGVRPLAWADKPPREQELKTGQIHVWAQERVLDWPADFVLATVTKSGQRHFAIIECDGHDFHERTKEQAERDRSRDRRVQELGWRIYRFTGSELYRNAAMLVMEEIFTNWAAAIWVDEP